MSNVRKITRKRTPETTIDFNGFSSYTGKKKRSPEGLLATAAVTAFVAMQMVCFGYEGFTPVYTGFAGIQLAGLGLGVALRRRTYDLLSCVGREVETEAKPKPHHRVIIRRAA